MLVKVKKLLNIISSRRFAIILLLFTTSVLLIGNLIPNPALMTPEETSVFVEKSPMLNEISRVFHVTNLTRSPYFLAIPVFIFLSISICTYRRVRMKLTELSQGKIIPAIDSLSYIHSYASQGTGDALKILERGGWKVATGENSGSRIFYARKGDSGLWGSVLFHGGMDIVIIGAVISLLTLFTGKIALTEGYSTEPIKSLGEMMTPFEKKIFPYRELYLESFEAVYERGDYPVDYIVGLKTLDRNGMAEAETFKMNQPLKKDGYQFILEDYYFTPRFKITGKDGGLIEDAFINLLVRTVDNTDEFTIADLGISIRGRFFPDFSQEGGQISTLTLELNNPVFMLEFFKWDIKIGDGILPIGKKMDFDEGKYTIEFVDLKRWVTIRISRDLGLPIVTGGLFLIVAGLFIRFILNEKRIWVVYEKEGVKVGGKAAYFPALFDEELRRIAGEIGEDEHIHAQA